MIVVDVCRGHHGAGVHMSDHRDDALVADESLRDVAGDDATARIVLEQDVQATLAGPLRAAVDLFESEVDAALVGGAIRLGPWSCGAEGYGANAATRACREREDQ